MSHWKLNAQGEWWFDRYSWVDEDDVQSNKVVRRDGRKVTSSASGKRHWLEHTHEMTTGSKCNVSGCEGERKFAYACGFWTCEEHDASHWCKGCDKERGYFASEEVMRRDDAKIEKLTMGEIIVRQSDGTTIRKIKNTRGATRTGGRGATITGTITAKAIANAIKKSNDRKLGQ